MFAFFPDFRRDTRGLAGFGPFLLPPGLPCFDTYGYNKLCEYEEEYFDITGRELHLYQCDRDCVENSRYCMFHDDDYFRSNKDKVKEQFDLELTLHDKISEPIFFIGCNIPKTDMNAIDDSLDDDGYKKDGEESLIAYFTYAKFHGDFDLYRRRFKLADFSRAVFYGQFRAIFVDIEMLKFTESDIGSGSSFEMCKFGTADFALTNFKDADFKNCTIRHVTFRESSFNGEVTFLVCDFNNMADFTVCKFLKESRFFGTVFHSKAWFDYSEFKAHTIFQDVIFKEQSLVNFGVDLSNVSFARTDITRVRFDGNTNWGGSDGCTTFDTRDFERNPARYDLTTILGTYRDLRENYEFRLMYEEAGKFFAKELDLKRTWRRNKDGSVMAQSKRQKYLSLTYCYKILCGYGEDLRRVSAWLLGLFAGTTAYFVFFDSSYMCFMPDYYALEYADKDVGPRIHMALERTLRSFLHIGCGLEEHIVRAISLPILGAMFIVLRRKFERRFRH